MRTIIFVNKYTSRNLEMYNVGTDAFFKYGMGQFIADEFQKRNYSVEFEHWRMDLRISDILTKTIDGQKCVVFPSKKNIIFEEYSREMISALRKLRGNKNVVFHFMGNHNLSFHLFASIVRKNNSVSTHLGGSNPLWNYNNTSNYKSKIFYFLEKYFFSKNYNHFIVISRVEENYYKTLKSNVTLMPIFGISRQEIFQIADKSEIRKKLGLPLNKKIVLQAGRAIYARGFKELFKILDNYKKNDEYYFVFAGVESENECYDELKSHNVFIDGYISQQKMAEYYQAADVLLFLPFGKMDLDFGGTGYVPLECLLCGTPVVATTFHHFPGEEIYEIARIPKNETDIIPMMEELLNIDIDKQRCREIVLKYFSWDKVIEKHKEIYFN